jgi:hypothetical protein
VKPLFLFCLTGADLTGAVQKTKTKRANSTPSPLLQLPGFEKEKML